jgi:ketosteroid isomerase-like protein
VIAGAPVEVREILHPAMSQKNVELVRAYIEALNRGDMDAAFSNLAADFEYDGTRALGPDSRGVFNRDQFREFLADFAEAWESAVRVEPHEFIEAGQRVVVPWTSRADGRDGLKLEATVIMAFTLQDGSISHIAMFQSKTEAREAAGPSE